MTRQTSSLLILVASGAAIVAPLALVLYGVVHPVWAGLGFLGVVCLVAVLSLHATRGR